MRRSTSLVTLTLLGVFLTAATYAARPPRASIHVTEVADNLYMLGSDPAGRGMGTGGNTAVFVMANRVVLVDTKLAGYGPDILEQVRSITDKSVTTIINTLALQRAGSNRPLLLRPWPHRRRLVRCVQGRADHAHG